MKTEIINFLQQSVEALRTELENANKTADKQKEIISELKETISTQASIIVELDSDILELNTKIDRLLCK